MSLLTAEKISVERAGRVLLADTSIQLAAGELHVLLGPNGAGKTTLLRALSGEWPTCTGEIRLGNDVLPRLDAPQQARRRAVLPQQDALAFGFTVRELITLGRHAAIDHRPDTTKQVIAAVLQATDTAHLAERRYPELSGGERRRAQLARVLAQVWDVPHAVLLLDEPVHSLDLGHQHTVLALLRTLAAKGFAILASLHELNLAAAYAQRVSLMQAGRIVATGTPETVLDSPRLKSLYGEDLSFTAIENAGSRQWLTAAEPTRSAIRTADPGAARS
ncbi:MAG: heme ABC transporter ATP-binding protein [Stagnimonas sp.]|nr:heme ABC transporter ATP-binding protein [Stagnimonas sp.]